MDLIKNILISKALALKDSRIAPGTLKKPRPLNTTWEEASEFGKYCRLSTPFVMKLFKIYGKQHVLGLRSYLQDSRCPTIMYAGMVVNKLKGLKK